MTSRATPLSSVTVSERAKLQRQLIERTRLATMGETAARSRTRDRQPAARHRHGHRADAAKSLLVGSFVLLDTGLFFALLNFWGEMLWFEELGQSQRFWTAVFAVGGFVVLGALVGASGSSF